MASIRSKTWFASPLLVAFLCSISKLNNNSKVFQGREEELYYSIKAYLMGEWRLPRADCPKVVGWRECAFVPVLVSGTATPPMLHRSESSPAISCPGTSQLSPQGTLGDMKNQQGPRRASPTCKCSVGQAELPRDCCCRIPAAFFLTLSGQKFS